MNGRLFPAVRVNMSLATVVRHRDRVAPNSYSEQPVHPRMTAALCGLKWDQESRLFHLLNHLFGRNFKFAQMRTRSHKGACTLARINTTRVLFQMSTEAFTRTGAHAKLWKHTKNSIQAVKLKYSHLTARAVVDAHGTWLTARWGASLSLVLIISHFLRLIFSMFSPYHCHPLQGRAWLHG